MNLAIQPTVRAMISESLGGVNSRLTELATRVDAVEAEPVGAVAQDPLFTTKGDLPVGTGTTPTTSQRLAAGADGAVLVADASAPGGLVYERRHFSHVIYGDSGVDAVWTNMPLAQALWLTRRAGQGPALPARWGERPRGGQRDGPASHRVARGLRPADTPVGGIAY